MFIYFSFYLLLITSIGVLLFEILFAFLEILVGSFSNLLASFLLLHLLLFQFILLFFTHSKHTYFIFFLCYFPYPKPLCVSFGCLVSLLALLYMVPCFWVFCIFWLWVHISWIYVCRNYLRAAFKMIFSKDDLQLVFINHWCHHWLKATVN